MTDAAPRRDDPLSPTRLEAAATIVRDAHDRIRQQCGGNRVEMTRALWLHMQRDKALRLAGVRLIVAHGQVQILADPGIVSGPGGAPDGVSAHMGPMPPNVPFDDPFTVAKVAAAREVFAAALARAAQQAAGDERAGRVLVWAWQRQDPELETALARLWALGMEPVAIIRMALPQAGALQ